MMMTISTYANVIKLKCFKTYSHKKDLIFSFPLKISENLTCSGVCGRDKKVAMAWNESKFYLTFWLPLEKFMLEVIPTK